MARRQLVELADARRCPRSLRDGLADVLGFLTRLGRFYDEAGERLAAVLRGLGETRILDLCSGTGGPWPQLLRLLRDESATDIRVTLSDWRPAPAVWEALGRATRGRLAFTVAPVDARQVPRELAGFRTIFSAFHHFPPTEARAILADAVAARVGIAVFEFTGRRWSALALVLSSPLVVPLVVPFVRPFRWSRLFWTYVLPLLPLLLCYDGVVSCLRTYTAAELAALTADLGQGDYVWETIETRARGIFPVRSSCLLGYPRSRAGG